MKKIGLVFSLVLFFLATLKLNAQWFLQNDGSPELHQYMTCYALDAENVWVVGTRQLKTTDGGDTWIEKGLWDHGLDALAHSVFFVDSLNGFIGGNHRLYKTTDGGDNWDVVYYLSEFGYEIMSIFFSNNNRGWIVGGFYGSYIGNFIAYTIDGGMNWTEITVPTENILLSISFSDSLHGYAVGGNGFIMKTDNGGMNWYQSSLGASDLLTVQFVSNLTGWISSYGGIYKTTDGGLNWIRHWVVPGTFGYYTTVFFVDSLYGYTSSQGGIFYSSNGGIDWIDQDFSSVLALYFADELNGWGVGYNNLIMHTTNGGVTFIEDDENNLTHPIKFLLQQNYPNPFNPSTTIQYAISSKQFVTLKVYDLLGREVATLVNEEKPAGSYNVEFRMQNLELSSGIYFYQLIAGDYVETKKMVLLR